MGSSSGGDMAKNPIGGLSARPGRRPLLSNTMLSLYRLYSHFPEEENPFAEFPDFIQSHTPGVWAAIEAPFRLDPLGTKSDGGRNDHAPRSKRETSVEVDGLGSGEGKSLITDNEKSDVGPTEVLCKDSCVNGSGIIIDDKLNGGEETETADRVACNEGGNKNQISEVQNITQGLLGVEKILMEESDDLGLLQMSDKDVNLDIIKDFVSFAGTDGLGNGSLPVESIRNDKLAVEMTLRGDVVVENKGKGVEAKNSTSGGNAGQSDAQVPLEKEKSGGSEVVLGASPIDTGKETEVNGREGPQNRSEIGGLIFSAQKGKNDDGTIPGDKAVDSIEKRHKSAVDKGKTKKSKKAAKDVDLTEKGHKSRAVDKGKTKKDKKEAQKGAYAIEKEHKSRAVDKGETKRHKEADQKDVKSGKHKHKCLDSGILNIVKAGGADTVANGKMLEENVQVNEENLSAKLVGKSGSTNCEKLQYTREQLMHLRKPGAVPENISKVVKEIGAQLHVDVKSPAVKEAVNASVCSKEQLNTSTEENNAEEMTPGILKKKKRGPSSEARKEKKKQKRRKKRAELNKKLGVKRLKLKSISKPNVVAHCRHYLKGRCHEGEKCKFSHDVVPLTKSKPCCHFARHTCMKGDDCPFDHQLSKYPCNNIVETGNCSRGDSCLFSHEIPAKEASETKVGVSKRQTCSLNQLDKSKQQVTASVSSSGMATAKNLKENLATQISQPPKAVKGITALSFGKSSLRNSAKLGEVDISKPNVDIAVTSGQSNLAVSFISDNSLMSIPGSRTPQRFGFLPPEGCSIGSSGTKNQASVSSGGLYGQIYPTVSAGAIDFNKSFSFPASLTPQGSFPSLEINSVSRAATKSQINVNVAGTGVQPNQTVEAKAAQLSTTLIFDPPSPTPQGEKTSAFGSVNQANLLPYGDRSVGSSGTMNQASVGSAGIYHGPKYPTVSAGAIDWNKHFMRFPAYPTPQVSLPSLEVNPVNRAVTKSHANVCVVGTGVQPSQTVQAKTAQWSTTLMFDRPSPTAQGEKTSACSSGNENQVNSLPYGDRDSSSFPSLGKPLLYESTNKGQVNKVNSLPHGDSSSFPLFGKPLLYESTSKGQLNQVNSLPYGDSSSFPSFGKPLLYESTDKGSLDSAHLLNGGKSSRVLDASDHKLQVGLSTDGHSVSQIENRIASESAKLKAVHSEVQLSPTSTSGVVKKTPDTAKRAILSTLAFAARYESRIKMSSAAANEVKKNEGTSTSGCKRKEPIKASDILERLYGGSRKEKL